jgi:hypothetical protein
MQKVIKMAYIHKQCSWKIHKKTKIQYTKPWNITL